ncbi:flagellar hook-associated protein FlgL [Variovorax boronicumulans]
MRISTQSFFEQSLQSMGLQQQKLFRVQQQLATNSKFLSAGDDPVGAARALGVSQTLAEGAQFTTSRQRAALALSTEENALDSVTSILQHVKTLVVQAGGGGLSDADRGSLATAIQSSLEQLVGVANSDNGNGQYLFAGFKSGSPPFVMADGGGVQYVGDQGERLMQIDVARQMSTSDDGRSIFQTVQGGAGYVASGAPANTGSGVFGAVSTTDATAPDYGRDFTIRFTGTDYTVMTKDTPPVVAASGTFTAGSPITFGGVQIAISGTPANGDSFDVSTAKNAGTDIFAALGELVTALRAPLNGGGAAAQAQLRNALSTANVKVTNAHDNVLTVLSSVGSRQVELEALDSAGAMNKLQEESYLSSIEDLDPYAAISDFYQRQSSLQATQMTFARLNSISLFNYL